MHFRYTTILFFACLGISSHMHATVILSQQNGNWHSTSTWFGGEIPETGDTVLIQAGDTVTLADQRACLRLVVEAGGKFNLNSNLVGYSSIHNDGHIAWSGGNFNASGDVENNNRLDIFGAFLHSTSGNIINMASGVINYTDGHLDYNGGGAQSLTNYGTFNANPTASISIYMTLQNHGTLQNSTTGTITLYTDLINHPAATVNFAMASLVIANTCNITQNGTLFINNTLTMQGGTHTLAAADGITGAGNLNITGPVVINSTNGWVPGFANATLGSTLSGNTSLTINPGTTWNWTSGTFSIIGGITNSGVLNVTSASNHVISSNIINMASGVINYTAGHLDYNGGGLQTLTNHGVFNANPGGSITIYMTIQNHGMFQNSTTGTITFYADLINYPAAIMNFAMASIVIANTCDITQNGTFFVNNTLTMQGGTHTLAAADGITGAGNLNITGTTTINSVTGWAPGFANATLGSTLSGNTSLTINSGSTWNWTSGTFNIIGDITNSGVLNVTGAFNHAISTDIINEASGVINYTNGHLDYNGGGSQTLTNYGTFNVNPGGSHTMYMTIQNHGMFQNSVAGTITIGADLINHPGASVNIAMASLVVTNNCDITQDGTFFVTTTLTLEGGTHTLAAADGITGAGNLNITGATTINSVNGWAPGFANATLGSTLSGTTSLMINSGSTWNWTGGAFNIIGDITNSGILNVTGAFNHSISSNINNTASGIINYTNGHLDYNGGGLQTLTNNGNVNVNPIGNHVIYMTIQNHGTFQNSVAGTITIDADLINHPGASVNIALASLVITNNCDITQDGTFFVTTTLTLQGGTHTLAAADGITGAGNMNITGATTINSVNGWAPGFDNATLGSTFSGNTSLTINSGSTWNWTSGTFTINGDINNSGILNVTGAFNHSISSNISNTASGIINYTTGHFDYNGGGLQTLTNYGTINANPGGTLTIYMTIENHGSFINTTTGNIDIYSSLTNHPGATIDIEDAVLNFRAVTMTNDGMISGNGVVFLENNAQVLAGDGSISNLTISNSSNVSQTGEQEITETLHFANGKLILGDADISVGSVTGQNSSRYVVTNSTGQLIQNVSTTTVLFPIGPTTTSYNPVQISQESGNDNYAVRVRIGLDNPLGTSGMVNRQWTIDRSGGNTIPASVEFQWNSPAHESGTFDPGMCEVFRWNGTLWDPLGAGAASCMSGICIRSEENLTDFSPFAIGNNISLPVTLISFKATARRDHKTDLYWATTDEINNALFEIERSIDAIHWEVLGSKPGLNAPGIHHYTFQDSSPFTGINYYRLRQVDFDGRYSYSPIAHVRFASNERGWSIGPNPCTDMLNVQKSADELLTVQLYSPCGRILHSGTLSGANETIDISHFPSGIFFLKLSNGDSEEIKRFVKQ